MKRPRSRRIVLMQWLVIGLLAALVVGFTVAMPTYIHPESTTTRSDGDGLNCGVTTYVSEQAAKDAGCR